MTARTVPALALALALCGCGSPQPRMQSGLRHAYRAWVTTSAGDRIPFLLELPANCNTDRAAIVNGTERISIPCQRLGGRVMLDFVVYGTRIAADIDARGSLTGQWSHAGGNFPSNDRVRFDAQPLDRLDPERRFALDAAGPQAESGRASIAGTWRLEFQSREPAKAVFQMAGEHVVHGTAEVPSEYGDLRYLAGTLRGSSLLLSTFDGTGAYLVRGRLEADDRMHGELIRADGTRDAFTAVRSPDFEVIDPLRRMQVTSAETRLDFAPLLTPRYAGKPVIVELFGTWCSNCNDLAPLLAELYATHRKDGLEILSVAFELSADESFLNDRLAEYKAAHGVEWEVMVAAVPPEELLSAGPARLSAVSGVPVTLFFNRDRTIRAIYTGFSGPATGAGHQKAIATFRELTNRILASRP
ncbi:MAG TPA: TlpA disulfide reductase family protein [Vicinamibacterales bacterium]|nr:TlpA disulfide reductase family protein [Vicinamibacterales bacterium]